MINFPVHQSALSGTRHSAGSEDLIQRPPAVCQRNGAALSVRDKTVRIDAERLEYGRSQIRAGDRMVLRVGGVSV